MSDSDQGHRWIEERLKSIEEKLDFLMTANKERLDRIEERENAALKDVYETIEKQVTVATSAVSREIVDTKERLKNYVTVAMFHKAKLQILVALVTVIGIPVVGWVILQIVAHVFPGAK